MPVEEVAKINRQPAGGPLGLGDPDDTFLRKVEKEVLIPQKMRDKAKTEKCIEEVKNFTECCASSGIAMVYKCRAENSLLKSCLSRWYDDDEFKRICKEEYLIERSEFRRTGIRKGSQRIGVSM
ncbi:COX assembly mitochondrial protein homolog [Harmonia axyridis]|uniref:COX assembly mitochondrial protein homolog n=1 Tax=Harmonia axyridis TaxID=115357 RepID=UPI001E274DD5|nr:COX assembly mitochondrial protein homolog [Harmonia axyridis]